MGGLYSKLASGEGRQESNSPAPTTVLQKPAVADKSTATTEKKSTKSTSAAMQQSSDAAMQLNEVAILHKALRQAAATNTSYRMSKMEKHRLAVALNELKMREFELGEEEALKTNENELVRIAVNHLLNDYRSNGETSVLVLTLKSLRA
jgi:hypothetical protein